MLELTDILAQTHTSKLQPEGALCKHTRFLFSVEKEETSCSLKKEEKEISFFSKKEGKEISFS